MTLFAEKAKVLLLRYVSLRGLYHLLIFAVVFLCHVGDAALLVVSVDKGGFKVEETRDLVWMCMAMGVKQV